MTKIFLITGGSRSGKSSFAQALAESMEGPRLFLATCPVVDEEMNDRIERHRQARSQAEWETLEETNDLKGALEKSSLFPVVLVDCLTLWINNLMYRAEQEGKEIDEEAMKGLAEEVVGACRERGGSIILVTNEVGLGIVPENPLARRYRDLVGRCNQVIAAEADSVVFVTCGIPLFLKGN